MEVLQKMIDVSMDTWGWVCCMVHDHNGDQGRGSYWSDGFEFGWSSLYW